MHKLSQGLLMEIGLWCLWIMATTQTLFFLAYATRPWWKHYVGKAMFWKALSLMIMLWISVSNNILDPYPYQLEITVGALIFVTLSIIGQTVALFLQVAHDRYDRKLAERAEEESQVPPTHQEQ